MSERSRLSRTTWVAAAGLVLLAAGVGAGYLVYWPPKGPGESEAGTGGPRSLSAQVHELCTACHAYPSPSSFPRWAWKNEVDQAFGFIQEFKPHLKGPTPDEVANYYENRAPLELPPAKVERADRPLGIRFEKIEAPSSSLPERPHVSNVQLVHLSSDSKLDILACDMEAGLVMALTPGDPAWRILSRAIPYPARAEVVDLDGDGIKDLLVANLGNFTPTDKKLGSVVWLRGQKDGTYKAHTLLDNVGRVADVRAAHFRSKEKLDLVVGVFGWRHVGEILLLENETTDWDNPKFVPRVLDDRHGTIHVPVADLNGDGKPDFVALIAQEHETVVAFLNEGNGKFRKETIYEANDPSYGSSGIQLVDLDRDGKLDVLYTNGDVMDSPHLLKPFHGIRWLKNMGTYPFEHRSLTAMYGVHAAVAADLGGTGRNDVLAVAFLPESAFPMRKEKQLDSVVLLEQTGSGKFARHTLEGVTCDHVSCAVGDLYGTGRLDLVIGRFGGPAGTSPVTIWRNHGPGK